MADEVAWKLWRLKDKGWIKFAFRAVSRTPGTFALERPHTLQGRHGAKAQVLLTGRQICRSPAAPEIFDEEDAGLKAVLEHGQHAK